MRATPRNFTWGVLQSPMATGPKPRLFGRIDELTQLDAMLDAARRGDSGALVIRGEPGVGKSSLLSAVIERADDFRVLRALGVESESDLAFSGLLELVRPVIGHIS